MRGLVAANAWLDHAIEEGDLEGVQAARLQGATWGAQSMWFAVISGNVDLVRTLHEDGVGWHGFSTHDASRGHLDCLRYAHQHGAEWSRFTTTLAAGGYLECLRYAHEHGASFDHTTMYAAASGHIECLAFAHEHGAIMDDYATCSAARGDHQDCLTYLVERGCPVRLCEDTWRNRVTIVRAMTRRRRVVTIQRAWRAIRMATRRRAVAIIEDAYITWACRPGCGSGVCRRLSH